MSLDLATVGAHAGPLPLLYEGSLLLGRSDVTVTTIDEGGSLPLVGLGGWLLVSSGSWHDYKVGDIQSERGFTCNMWCLRISLFDLLVHDSNDGAVQPLSIEVCLGVVVVDCLWSGSWFV